MSLLAMDKKIFENDFQLKLFNWFLKNGRDLPWRKTKDPYSVWVSEIMLQQTQVDRVRDFFNRFMVRFPKIEDLATASWEDVLEYWRGLGYYRRARNLHLAAKKIVEDFHSIFPQDFKELQKLPGIGIYTAAAILSFAFDQSLPALDTNIKRVFVRIFGEKFEQLTLKGQFDFALGYIAAGQGAFFNHALMDLGATVCTARQPKCEVCPFINNCSFAKNLKNKLAEFQGKQILINDFTVMKTKHLKKQSSMVLADKTSHSYNENFQPEFIEKEDIPSMQNLVTSPVTVKKIVKVAAGVVIRDGKVLISKRRKGDAFAGFWEFPGGKLEIGENERICLKRELKEELDIEVSVRPAFHKTFTEHNGRTILLSFHRCSLLLGEPKAQEVEEFLWVDPSQLSEFPFPPANKNVIEILLHKKAMFRV